MKALDSRLMETCFDGTLIYHIDLSRPMNAGDFKQLSGLGEFEIRPDLPKPFYRLTIPGGIQLKGSLENPFLRLRIPPDKQNSGKSSPINLINHYFSTLS